MDAKSGQPATRLPFPEVQTSQLPDQNLAGGRRPSAPGSSAVNTASFGRNQARYRVPKGGITPHFPGLTARPRTRSVVRLEELEKEQPQDPQPSAKSVEIGDGGNQADPLAPEIWRPDLALNAPLWLEHEDPSLIEIADRDIAQKRHWVEYYRGMPEFPRLLEEAIKKRREMDENDVENTIPRSTVPSIQQRAIAQRLVELREVLQTSTFPPERANITAAIAGYESGAIPFSTEHYTIIWAGRIVDRCPDYASFTYDREERLDRYYATYGPGWLWYEPPLTTSTAPMIRAFKGVCLSNTNRQSTEGMGHYTIRMSFRRRRALHARPSTAAALPVPRGRFKVPTAPCPTEPRVYWTMLLDSGATFPCIYESDLATLNIDPRTYAAVCSRRLATAQGVVTTLTYELDVGVHHPDESTLVTSDPRVWPAEQDVLGGVSTVIALRGSPPQHPGASGDEEPVPDRLSGILPFHACYMSSAPGNYKVWLGEDRREVLGAGRLPGQMRFAAWKEDFEWKRRPERKPFPFSLDTGRPAGVERLGTPDRVMFEHDVPGGVVRDRDAGGGKSLITVGPRGAGAQRKHAYHVEPRKLPEQQSALGKRKRESSGTDASAKSPTSGRNLRPRTK